MPRTLIAGFGNVLRGDDGFGVAVLQRLEPGEGVELLEVGTGGVRLAQELLDGYDRLIIVDTMARGGRPGSVYVLEVDKVEAATEIDLHLAFPSRALSVAQALSALPPEVFLVGCEPAEVDQLTTELSRPVQQALDVAIVEIRQLLAREVRRG